MKDFAFAFDDEIFGCNQLVRLGSKPHEATDAGPHLGALIMTGQLPDS